MHTYHEILRRLRHDIRATIVLDSELNYVRRLNMESPSQKQLRISEPGGGKFANDLPVRFQLLPSGAVEVSGS